MDQRQLDLVEVESTPSDIILRSPPNWTAIIFLLVLGLVHLCIAIPSFALGRWEGFLSLALGSLFVIVSIVCRICTHEISILPARKCLMVRTGWRRLSIERSIPFHEIRGVRVTLAGGGKHPESRIELLCKDEDLECPPTAVPRQEALLLALAMNVPLIKVMDDESHAEVARL